MGQKFFITLAFVWILIPFANGQNQKEILKREGITRIKIYNNDYGNEHIALELKLDSNGNIIDSLAYYSNGSYEGHVSKKFDYQSQIIEKTIFFQSGSNEFISIQEIFEYDSKGRIIKYETKYPNTQDREQSCSFEYIDNADNLTLTKIEECNGTKRKIQYKYNKQRDLTEEKYSTYTVTYKHTYHKNGNLKSIISYGAPGLEEWIYDESGILIEYTQIGRNNWVYTIDENGNKTKITNNPLGSSIISLFETELTYNHQNQIITRLEKSGESGNIDDYFVYNYSSTGLLTNILNFKTNDTNTEPKEITRYEYQ